MADIAGGKCRGIICQSVHPLWGQASMLGDGYTPKVISTCTLHSTSRQLCMSYARLIGPSVGDQFVHAATSHERISGSVHRDSQQGTQVHSQAPKYDRPKFDDYFVAHT